MEKMKEILMDILKHHPYSEEGKYLQNCLKRHSFPKNQIIFYQGDEAQNLYMVNDGLVTLNRYTEDGDLRYHDLIVPELFFPINALYGEDQYAYEAVALTKVETWQIKKKDLVHFLERFPKYFPYMYHDLALVNERIEERLHFMLTANAKDRIYHVIETILCDYGEMNHHTCSLPWPITITELAQMSGTTRETASLVLSELKRDGKINYDKKRLSISSKE